MATVFNNIDKVDRNPISGDVYIELLWDTSVSPVAKIDDDDTMVRGVYGMAIDEDGYWEMSLTPNDVILPADSVYKISEEVNSIVTTYYVSVPDSATPTFWAGDLIVSEPDWV